MIPPEWLYRKWPSSRELGAQVRVPHERVFIRGVEASPGAPHLAEMWDRTLPALTRLTARQRISCDRALSSGAKLIAKRPLSRILSAIRVPGAILRICKNVGMYPKSNGLLESSLYVQNVAASARFYARIFGFRTISDFGERGCALQAGEHQVLLLFKKGGSLHIPSPHDGDGELHVPSRFRLPN